MKTAVVLVNLGTPTEPTKKGVRNFLKPFLSDRRVVDLPPMLWLPILYCIILPFRSAKVAKLYQSIWTHEGSPLLKITRAQAAGVAKLLSVRIAAARTQLHLSRKAACLQSSSSFSSSSSSPLPSEAIAERVADAVSAFLLHDTEGAGGEDWRGRAVPWVADESNITTEVVVSYAMTYTDAATPTATPTIAGEIHRLSRDEGCERVIVLPMFPQYSSTTVGPIYSQIAALYASDVNVPDVRVVHDYHRRRDFITALAASVLRHRRAVYGENGMFGARRAPAPSPSPAANLVEGGAGAVAAAGPPPPQMLLFSFHGIPKRITEGPHGDPYPAHCYATAKAVADMLGLEEGSEWRMCYQSRFGKAEWLQPYADDVLAALPTEAMGCVRSVDVICPAFSADCLETLEEMVHGAREKFITAGGAHYSVVPCLNASEDHIAVLANIAMDEMRF